jgi:cell shape-determining protein MreC
MRKRLLTALAVLFVVSLLLLLTRSNPVNSFFQQITQQLFSKPKSSLYEMGVGRSAADELTQLKKENQSLTEQLVAMEQVKRDNTALRDQFEETSVDPSVLFPVTVVGFQGSIENPEVLVIDTTGDPRVVTGRAVVVGNNLIGSIEKVDGRFASMRLVTHGSFATVAKSSQSGALGVVKGAGDFMVMEEIAITDSVENGHIIVTRGSITNSGDGIVPELVIGKVTAVNKVQSDPFQTARVESLIDIAHLTRVFVYIP